MIPISSVARLDRDSTFGGTSRAMLTCDGVVSTVKEGAPLTRQ